MRKKKKKTGLYLQCLSVFGCAVLLRKMSPLSDYKHKITVNLSFKIINQENLVYMITSIPQRN